MVPDYLGRCNLVSGALNSEPEGGRREICAPALPALKMKEEVRR